MNNDGKLNINNKLVLEIFYYLSPLITIKWPNIKIKLENICQKFPYQVVAV